ncbi:MAG: phosphotransferase [Pseudomonadota bacterium]
MSDALPNTVEQVSNGWLSGVLGVPVSDVQILSSDSGTTGRARLALSYGSQTHLPGQIFVKLPPTDPGQRAFVQSSGMGRREALFYRHLGAEIPLRVPGALYADTSEDGADYIMLLEDLAHSGCSFFNASESYSLDYVRAMLDAFARMHGQYWQSERFDGDLDWVEPLLQHDIAVQLVQAALDQFAHQMPPVFSRMARLYLDRPDAIHALWRQGEDTLLHGDVHDGNLFMDAGEPGFFDWALLARGPAMRDVAYFLAGTLREEHRTQQRELIDYYRSRLEDEGVTAPSTQHLWEQHQWHAPYVWVGAAVTLAMGDAWQPVNFTTKSLQNIHAVMDMIDSVDAIAANT